MTTGRPTKLTPTRARKLYKAIKDGLPLDAAAPFTGIDRVTLWTWLKRGARARELATTTGEAIPQEDWPYVALSQQIERAQAEWERAKLDAIEGHEDEEWTAAAWQLERRMPAKYGRRDRVDHSHALNVVLPAVPPPDQEPPEQIEAVTDEHLLPPSTDRS